MQQTYLPQPEICEAAFEHLSLACMVVDGRGQVVALNGAAARFVGRPAPECVGAALEWLLALEAGVFEARVRHELARSPRWRAQFGFVLDDGRTGTAEVTVVPMQPAARDSYLVTVEDVSARLAEEAERTTLAATLKRAASEWQRSFDASDTVIAITDPAGRVRRLNRAAAREAHREFADCLGKHLEALGPGQPWRLASELCTLAGVHGTHAEGRTEDSRDGRRWVVIVNSVADGAGGVESLVVSARVLPALRASGEKPGGGDEELRRALRGLAHDLRNPVFAIGMALDSLKQRATTVDSELLDALRVDLQEVDRLIADLTAFSQRIDSVLHPGDLGALVERAVASHAEHARRRDARVELSVEAAVRSQPALLDERLTGQALAILVAHALDNAPAESTVEIEVRARPHEKLRAVQCRIRDRGLEYAADDLSHVFDPFFARRRRGSGLGLAIARRLVEAQGGILSAALADGGGVAVTLELPCPASAS